MRDIQLRGSVELVAAGEPGKVPTFSMVAYTGAAMKPGGYGLVIVDAAGVSVPLENFPVLRDHDVTKIIGHAERHEVRKDGAILVEGRVSGANEHAKEIVESAKLGFRWQASVGMSVEKSEFVEVGATATANGKAIKGPVTIIRGSTLREVSFVPIGADPQTSASIAAKNHLGDKGKTMNEFDQWLQAAGFDVATLTDVQRTALQAGYAKAHPQPKRGNPHGEPAGEAVIDAIFARYMSNALPEQHADLKAARDQAVTLNMDAKQAELALLLADRGQTRHINNRQPVRANVAEADVLTASLLTGLGMPAAQVGQHFGERVTNEAVKASNRSLGIQGLFRSVIRAAGGHVTEGRMTDADIRAGFTASQRLEASGYSTISLPNILGNAAHKMLLSSFTGTSTTWMKFARRGSNSNFKEHTRYRMTAEGQFREVGPAGELTHVTLTEESMTSTLGTHGAMIALTRRDIINDDLSAFAQIPRLLGRMAAVAVEKATFTKLLANAGSFFSSGNANYESGAGSALAAAGLNAALARFRNQRDDNTDPVFIEPSVLLVPPALEATAKALISSTEVVGSTTANALLPSGNPYANIAEVVVAPYLSTAFGLTNASNAGWYLLTSPSDYSVIEVATLNGMEGPTVESADTDFNTLGIQMRAYFDFAVSLAEHRGGVFSVGS